MKVENIRDFSLKETKQMESLNNELLLAEIIMDTSK
jgi:hypothetical protein